MVASKEVIIVGAGIIGASIAWHLTRAGAGVTIVETAAPGGVATPASFAWINATWGNPEPYFKLRMRSIAEWTQLKAAVPDIHLGWTGGLRWDLPPSDLEAFAAEYGSWGYGIRRVERSEAARIEPNLVEPPDLAVHVAGEGAVEPALAARALVADAVRGGATLLSGTRVLALVHENGRVAGIRTADGIVRTDEVVLAAGIASPAIAATAGIDLSLDTPPGLLVHSRPHGKLLNGLVLAERLHMRQTVEGRIVAGSDFGGTDPGADPVETARALFAEMKAMLRDGGSLVFDFHTLGYRPTPSDGFPIIGRAGGVNGLYVTVMHSGITLAPIVGLFATRELTTGRRDPLLAPYGLDRFSQ
jgi:glycine/D-amino acid oxidase-like deaminating enzyme